MTTMPSRSRAAACRSLILLPVCLLVLLPLLSCGGGGGDDLTGQLTIDTWGLTPWSPTPADPLTVTVTKFVVKDALAGNLEFQLLSVPDGTVITSQVRAYDHGDPVSVTFAPQPAGVYDVRVLFEGNELGSNDPLDDEETVRFGVGDCGDGPYLRSRPSKIDNHYVNFIAPSAQPGIAYDFQLPIAGDAPPFTVEPDAIATPSTPPYGLSISATGRITGMPVANGDPSLFYVVLKDSCATGVRQKSYGIGIELLADCGSQTVTLGDLSTSAATVGTEFRDEIPVSGGSGLATLSITGGSGQADFRIVQQGSSPSTAEYFLVGIPTIAGAVTLEILATDECTPPVTATRTYTLTAAAGTGCSPTLSVPAQTPPLGNVSTPYSFTIDASGGAGARHFALSSDAGFDLLPAGLTLDANNITGTPTTAGTTTTRIVVTDSCPASIAGPQLRTVDLTFVIDPPLCPVLDIATPVLPNAVIGVAYSETLATGGGVPSITWSLVPPSVLPAWLTMTPSGSLTGTPPDQTGSPFSFTIRATDSCTTPGPQSVDKTFVLNVNPPGPPSWEHHEVLDKFTTPAEAIFPEIADEESVGILPSGRPYCIVYGEPLVAGGPTGLLMAVANTTSPSSSSDWSMFVLDAVPSRSLDSPCAPASAIINGKLAIIYQGDAGFRYARALVDNPDSPADFDNTEMIFESTGILSPGRNMVELNGRPAIVHSGFRSYPLICTIGDNAAPTGPADWEAHEMLQAIPEDVQNPQVIAVNNRLIVAYVRHETPFETTASIAVSVSIDDEPFHNGSWTNHQLTSPTSLSTRLGLSLVGGVPVIVTGTGDNTATGQEVHLYRATTALPESAGEWTQVVVPIDGTDAKGYHCDVIDDNGFVLLAVGEYDGTRRVFAARSLLAAPSANASDWVIEEIDQLTSRSTSPHLLIAGGVPRVIYPSHWDVDVYMSSRSAAY